MASTSFKIYRIGRKSDGKFLNCFRGYKPRKGCCKSYFTNQGAFHKRKETINYKLEYLTKNDGYKIEDLFIQEFCVEWGTMKQHEANNF